MENEIDFINMKQDFLEEYLDDNSLAYGFYNTEMGVGHLNKTGHRVIAKRLLEELQGGEKGRLVIPLLFYTLFIYKTSILISKTTRKQSKIITCVGIGSSVLLLFYFKYMHFFLEEIFNLPGTAKNIIVPIGISFIVLSAVGYLLDVYKRKYAVNQDIVEVILFLCYFPKILSGPIERQDEFSKKINAIIPISKPRLWQGRQIIFYPISCDFSGYTDIARGTSYLLGVSLERNFDLPYSASNPAEFWRRWHISLSSWFRDYVYIPLGGSRCGTVKTYRNIILTMLISGVWHGANWTYWIWGIMHGTAQCIHRLWGGLKEKYLPNRRNGVPKSVLIVCNLAFICITWTVFRAKSIGQFWMICKRVVTLQPGIDYFYTWTVSFAALIAGATIYGYKKNNGHGLYPEIKRMDFWGQVVFWVVVFLIVGFAYMGNMAFIYNNF